MVNGSIQTSDSSNDSNSDSSNSSSSTVISRSISSRSDDNSSSGSGSRSRSSNRFRFVRTVPERLRGIEFTKIILNASPRSRFEHSGVLPGAKLHG